MKLIIAVVNNDDASNLNIALMKEGLQVTKLATTGGFLRAGNTTLMIGCEDEAESKVKELIALNCKMRKEIVPTAISTPFAAVGFDALPMEVTVGGATVFTLNIESFDKL